MSELPEVPSGHRLNEILLVDDDESDIRLAREALRVCGSRMTMVAAKSGKEAVALLQQRAIKHPDQPACLVLLDLNMPGWDGETTVSHIRADARIRTTPVIVLTTSTYHNDIGHSYLAGANAYVVKPLHFRALVQFFTDLDKFWAQYVVFPKSAAADQAAPAA